MEQRGSCRIRDMISFVTFIGEGLGYMCSDVIFSLLLSIMHCIFFFLLLNTLRAPTAWDRYLL